MRLTGHIHHPNFISPPPRANPAADDITVETVAVMLKVKPSTVSDWARRGIIPSYKIGKFRRYSRRDISAWMQSHQNGDSGIHETES